MRGYIHCQKGGLKGASAHVRRHRVIGTYARRKFPFETGSIFGSASSDGVQ